MLLNQKDESSKSFVWLTITIHILPIILLSKSNKTNKIGQLIEYSKIYIFLQKSCKQWGREISSWPLFFFFKKKLHEVKASGLQLSFNIFWLIYFDSPQLGKQKKTVYNFRLLIQRYADF